MIEKNRFIYNLVKEIIQDYGNRHNVTGMEFFAPHLGFGGKVPAQQLINTLNTTSYNPAAPKRLSVDQFGMLLKHLDEHGRRELMEQFNNHFGYGTVCVRQGVDAELDVISVFEMLLELDEKHGVLARTVRDAIQDREIDQDECKSIKRGAYMLRQMAMKLEELADGSCREKQ